MGNRHAVTVGLWLLSAAAVALFVLEGIPWLWPRLFPGTGASPGDDAQALVESAEPSLTSELAMEVLRRTLAGLGATGEEAGTGIALPRGKSARDLELALRADPRLDGTEVYVTRVDDLLDRVRVFDGKQLLLQEDVRPWLPDRPVVSTADPPEMGLVVLFRREADQAVQEVGQWRAPVAIGVPPGEPHTVRTARQASWSSKGVVVVVEPFGDLVEQLGSADDAGGVLLEEALADGIDPKEWLKPLADKGLFLIDGTGDESRRLQTVALEMGVRYLRRSVHLDPDDPFTEVLARNLTVRRGHGLVTIEGTERNIRHASEFIEVARGDGYSLRFPVEVARQHGAERAGQVSGR